MAESETKNIYDQTTIYELNKWLEAVIGDNEKNLQIDPDVHDIESLLKIKTVNEEVEKNTKEIVKSNKKLINEYNEKSKEIEDLILSEGVSLSEETEKQIEKIAELAVELNLKEPDETNFLLAICDLQSSQLKKQQQRHKQTYDLETLCKKIVKVQEQNQHIEKEIEKLEEIVEIQNSRKGKVKDHLDITIKKTANYNHSIRTYKDVLEERGFTDSIMHSELVEKAQEIEMFEKEVQKLQAKLDSYNSLAPCQMLAQLQVQKKQEELKELETKFQNFLKQFFE